MTSDRENKGDALSPYVLDDEQRVESNTKIQTLFRSWDFDGLPFHQGRFVCLSMIPLLLSLSLSLSLSRPSDQSEEKVDRNDSVHLLFQ